MGALIGSSRTGGSLLAEFAAQMAQGAAMRRAADEARAAREEAERSVRSRSDFLANMNHELRTPLNAIIGFSTMLREADAYRLSETQRGDYAEFILQSADLLLSHVNTILSVAALEAKSVVPENAVFDAGAALAAAVERARVAAAASGAALDVRSGAAGAEAIGDGPRFGQALDHVLRAAIVSSERGGRVVARIGGGEGRFEIAVRDFGAGFGRDEIDRMLSVFSETHRGLDRALAGPGLGLAVARSFVELMGGGFAIESRKGKGSIVRLSLPAAVAAEVASEGGDAPRRLAS